MLHDNQRGEASMRVLVMALGLVIASGCGSKSSEADSGGMVFSDGVDDGSSNADADADGGPGTDADAGDDGGTNVDSDSDGGSDDTGDSTDSDGGSDDTGDSTDSDGGSDDTGGSTDADGGSDDTGGSTDSDGGSDDTGASTDADADAGADDTGSPEDSGDPVFEPTLSLELDVAAAIAGSPVGYQVILTTGDEVSVATESLIESDLVEDVPVDSGELTLVLAGTHTLTATALGPDGVTRTAAATLVVEAAELDHLIVSMGAAEVIAGSSNSYSLAGTDEYGNDRDVGAAELSASDSSITVTDSVVTTTVAGTHTLTATLDGITDSGTWEVLPGEPASIVLWLEETDLDAGDDTDFTVTVYDEYGNETDSAYTITVEGGDYDLDDDEIEFEEDGVYTVHAEVDGTDIHDSQTVVIDSSGPVIDVVTPDRGHWTTATKVTVEGTAVDGISSVASITVNGEAVDEVVGSDFSHEVNLGFGVKVIETIAEDDDVDEEGVGNTSSDVRSVLKANEFHSVSALFEEGMVIRLYEDDGGMGGLEDLAEDMVAASGLTSEIEGQIFDEDYCIWMPWPIDEACYGVEGYVEDFSHSPIVVDLNPTAGGGSGGLLVTTVTLPNVHVDWRIDHLMSFMGLGSGTIDASAIVVQANLDPSVTSGGDLNVTMTDLTVTTSGYSFDMNGPADTILGYIGVDVGNMVKNMMEDEIRNAVEEIVPDLVEDTLDDIVIDQDFDLADNAYNLDARIQDVVITGNSMTLLMESRVTPDEVLGAGAEMDDAPVGFPAYGWIAPYSTMSGSGTHIGLSTDFLNQMLFAFWRGGMFDQDLTDADLDLDMATISFVMPGLDELTMVTTPTLPPVLVPRYTTELGHHHELQMGDMLVQIYNGDVTEETLYMEMYLALTAPTELAADGATSIEIAIDDPTVQVDVVYTTDSYTASAEETEALFATLMATFLPDITGEALGSFPLPEFAMFSLTDVSTTMAGEDAVPGYWMLQGSLE
jgi:hypothetical protein